MGHKTKKVQNCAITSNNNSQSQVRSKSHNQFKTDHENFLQTYEKPTLIYLHLQRRALISPIFLHRTLSFMKKRRTKLDKSRKNFKVDSLLGQKESEIRKNRAKQLDRVMNLNLNSFLNLTFLGYYNHKLEKSTDKVSVELILVKPSNKKEKEGAFPYVQSSLGSIEIQVNPSEDTPTSKAMVILFQKFYAVQLYMLWSVVCD